MRCAAVLFTPAAAGVCRPPFIRSLIALHLCRFVSTYSLILAQRDSCRRLWQPRPLGRHHGCNPGGGPALECESGFRDRPASQSGLEFARLTRHFVRCRERGSSCAFRASIDAGPSRVAIISAAGFSRADHHHQPRPLFQRLILRARKSVGGPEAVHTGVRA